MEITATQHKRALELADKLGIGEEDIYFLNPDKPDEAWLSPNALTTLARKSPELRSVSEDYVNYIAPLNQVVHRAVVIDAQGRDFARTGIATIGEKPGMDEHFLAAGRALSAALTAAGFNPLKAGNVVALAAASEQRSVTSEAEQRRRDLGRIKIVARECGYITDSAFGADFTHYRATLERLYGVRTAAALDADERASFIQYMLTNAPHIAEAPDEFQELEVAA
jgi:hypothetical protein